MRGAVAAAVVIAMVFFLLAQPAAAACGFNQYNDYICDGAGGAPAVNKTAPPFPVPKTTTSRPSPRATGSWTRSGVDYQAEIRKLREQIAADEQRLEDYLTNPPSFGTGFSMACGEMVKFFDFESGMPAFNTASSAFRAEVPAEILVDPDGNHLLRITASPDDHFSVPAGSQTVRSLVSVGGGGKITESDSVRTYDLSVRFSDESPQTTTVMQLFQYGDGGGYAVKDDSGPSLRLYRKDGALIVMNEYDQNTKQQDLVLGKIGIDEFAHISITVDWSLDPAKGRVDVRVNGNHAGSLTGKPTILGPTALKFPDMHIGSYGGAGVGSIDFDNVGYGKGGPAGSGCGDSSASSPGVGMAGASTSKPVPVNGGSGYYVSPSGSGSGDGSIDSPFGSIAAAMKVLKPGDVLYLRQGSYGAISYHDMFIPSGTSWDNPVAIASYPGETATISRIELVGNTHHVIFDGLVIDNNYSYHQAVYISGGAGHIRVQNSEIMHGKGQGVLIPKSSAGYNEFINVDVHDNGTRAHLDHGMYIAASNNVIVNSRIHDNAAYGVHVYNSDQLTANNNIVSDNLVYGNGTLGGTSYGIILSKGDGNQAYNNTVADNHGGITVDYGCTNCVVSNNQVSGNSATGIYIGAGASGTTVQDNTVSGNGAGSIINAGSGTVSSGNTCDSAGYGC